MKKCTKCKEEKDETEFYKTKNYKDGLASQCKQCYKDRARSNHEKYYNNYNDNIIAQEKICPKCRNLKSSDKFLPSRFHKTGLSSWCVECLNNKKRSLKYANLENLSINMSKKCSKCGAIKTSDSYRVNRTTKDGYSYKCKDCEQINTKNRVYKYSINAANAGWINRLVRRGVLNKPNFYMCSYFKCTDNAKEYHHLKYDSRDNKDTISIIAPVCDLCHKEIHIKLKDNLFNLDDIKFKILLEYNGRKKPFIKFIEEAV